MYSLGVKEKGEKKNNKIAALGFTVIFSLAIHSYIFFVSFFSVFFLMIFTTCNFICLFCFISMIFPILIEVGIEENNKMYTHMINYVISRVSS